MIWTVHGVVFAVFCFRLQLQDKLYQSAEVLTHDGHSQIRGSMIHMATGGSCHGLADCGSNGFCSS
jgi:hypothetical protein